MYINEIECAKLALQLQDASNIGGFLDTYREIVLSLRDEYGYDYEYSKNPIVILIHDKLEDMLRIEKRSYTFEDYDRAYVAVKKMIREAGA